MLAEALGYILSRITFTKDSFTIFFLICQRPSSEGDQFSKFINFAEMEGFCNVVIEAILIYLVFLKRYAESIGSIDQ